MQIIDLSKREFNKLKLLDLPRSVISTEAKLFIFPSKTNWVKNENILKCFYVNNNTYFSNKLYTINELTDKKVEIGIDELVMPIALVAVGGELVGYIMPYIKNINFKTIIQNQNISIEKKLKYLQEIGMILERLSKVRQYTAVKDIFLNDLHENNFILNLETGKINAVDLDSCKISENKIFPSKYLSLDNQLKLISKYHQTKDRLSKNYFGVNFEIDENTDLYCYIIIIFQLFYGGNIGKLTIAEYYEYLEYLSSIGISKEILDIFSTIYINKNNINPYEYLEELVPFYDKTKKEAYERVKKIR